MQEKLYEETINTENTENTEETMKEEVPEMGNGKISKKDTLGIKNIIEKESLQFNSQDLEQEQNVDVNPVQVNAQNIHIHLHDNKNYSSKITGTTYLERNRNILRNVKIYLYFGHEGFFPVHETISDHNGNFTFEDIPPGYYTLIARYEGYEYRSHYIKVLPCTSVHHSVLLR
ncbi:MAG TPA: carboxypeptidase regulatory-like domain-containing protein [Clostridiaceae bacterium]|nr:carboxypeptidase regulatory-like domain-containing protein [Clostridiaceae bacterium]